MKTIYKTQQVAKAAVDLDSKQNLRSAFPKLVKTTVLLFISMLFYENAQSQIVFQPTRVISESAKHVDVFSTVQRCDTVNYVNLTVLNESKDTQDITFTIYIRSNENDKSFSETIKLTGIEPTKKVEGTCSNKNSLSIALPTSYNPNTVTLTVKF